MHSYKKLLAVFPISAALHCGSAYAQLSNQQSFSGQNNTISPFGYGNVVQGFPMVAGKTGNAICAATATPTCLSTSGQGDCSWQVGTDTLVSCNQNGKQNVNETPFTPVNCNNNLDGDGGASGLITGADWCGWASYMAQRTVDSIYQYNDYVRLGVNKRFGGTVFELYGTDKLDRIQQHPGGATQLALYGDDLGYAPAGTPSGWFATNSSPNFLLPAALGWDNHAYGSQASCQAAHPGATCTLRMAADNVSDDITNVGCANNGADAGVGFNPVQAVSQNCWYGDPNNYVDDVYSPASGYLTVDKHAPANYSKSSNVPGLFWAQTSQVVGPFAQLTYDIKGGDALRTMTPDFQELPAIFLHQGIGAQVYYYTGANAYNAISQPVTMATLAVGATGILGFTPRSGQYGAGYDVGLTEDWASMCDASGTKCVTIASFSNAAQIIQASNSATNSYFGIHGFFTMAPGLNQRATVFIAPYRFDDIVQGQSVRQWVYQLHQNPLLPPAPVHSPTN